MASKASLHHHWENPKGFQQVDGEQLVLHVATRWWWWCGSVAGGGGVGLLLLLLLLQQQQAAVVTYASGTGSGTHPDTTALSTKPRCSTQIWQIQNQEIYLSLPDTNPLQTARDESAENIWWQNVCGAVTRRYADEGRLHPPTPRVRSHRNISRIPWKNRETFLKEILRNFADIRPRFWQKYAWSGVRRYAGGGGHH